MLTARPSSWFSWNCDIYDDDAFVGSMSIDWFREAGKIRVGGRSFSVRRAGFMNGPFVLSGDDGPVASATKPSAFARLFIVEVGDRQYTVRSASVFALRCARLFRLVLQHGKRGSSPGSRAS